MRYLVLCITIAFFSACVTPSNPSSNNANKRSKPFSYELLSKEAASSVVTTDKKEGYFDKVVKLEMSIQMKKDLSETPRKEALAEYKAYLKEDLMDFSEEEEKIVKKIFDEALALCQKVSPKLKLPTIQLIKTRGRYYGETVFFTRDNAIVIPEIMIPRELEGDHSGFLSTMLHEIFHIYSRYNKDKRDALYERLGFERLPKIALSDFLKKRVLYNPDGVDLRYAITVKDKDNRSFKAMPIIYSKYKTFDSKRPAFFGYLYFQLFEVQQKEGVWTVVNENVGYDLDEITGFWEQVTRNTNYNIHPDELCADNFVILAESKKEGGQEVINQLDADGQKLVKDFEEILLGE